jgi:hypothetical protein
MSDPTHAAQGKDTEMSEATCPRGLRRAWLRLWLRYYAVTFGWNLYFTCEMLWLHGHPEYVWAEYPHTFKERP